MDDNHKFCLSDCSKCCADNIELTYTEFAYLSKGISEKSIKELCSVNSGRCIFLDDRGKCIVYERRLWICRNFRRFPETDSCGSERIHQGEITDNFLAEMDITKVNNQILPPEYRGIKRLREWIDIG